MEIKIKFGWVCPVCKEVYDTEDEASTCLNNHIDYSVEPSYALSSPWPINIRVWKTVGGRPVAWKDYDPDPQIHKVKQ